MNKTIMSAAMLLSFSVIAMSANAAEIQFSGAVTAKSCTLENGDNLIMQLPTFGINEVAEVGQHNGVTTVSAVAKCPSATEDGVVTMSMVPNQSSFEGKVLKNTHIGDDAAKGVGIVVMGDDHLPLDFLGTSAKITAPMTGGVANIMVSATYAKDGSGAVVEAGKVAAVLPFVMTYE